jgi:hypothetical protein
LLALDGGSDFGSGDIFAFPAEGVSDAIDEVVEVVIILAHEIARAKPCVATLEHVPQNLTAAATSEVRVASPPWIHMDPYGCMCGETWARYSDRFDKIRRHDDVFWIDKIEAMGERRPHKVGVEKSNHAPRPGNVDPDRHVFRPVRHHQTDGVSLPNPLGQRPTGVTVCVRSRKLKCSRSRPLMCKGSVTRLAYC